MEFKHNFYPILFSGKTISCWSCPETGTTNPEYPECTSEGIVFFHGGNKHLIPFTSEKPQGDWSKTTIQPEMYSEPLKLWIHEIILRTLTLQGYTHISESTFEFIPPEPAGNSTRLVLEIIKPEGKQYLLCLMVSSLNKFSEGKEIYNRICDQAAVLRQIKFSNGSDGAFTIGDQGETSSLAEIQGFDGSMFYFRPSGAYSATGKMSGLSEYGPYSTESLNTKTIHVLTVCNREYEGSFGSLIKDLCTGIPHGYQNGYYPWKKGWKDLYRVGAVQIYKEVYPDNASPEAIKNIISHKLENLHNQRIKIDLAFYNTRPEDAQLAPSNDPYVLIKSFLLDFGIPSQAMRAEQLCDMGEYSRAEAIARIALAAYAKLGGKPWLLPVPHADAHELVIGLEVSVNEAMGNTISGFSAIFSSNGDYKVAAPLRVSEINKIPMEIGLLLERVKKQQNWMSGQPVRMVFHLPDKIENGFVAQLKNDLHNLLAHEHETSFAFLILSYGHNYRIWDLSKVAHQKPEYQYVPERGAYLRLDKNNALIQLGDTKSRNTHPLLVTLHPESDYTDLRFLAKQVFAFSDMSWRQLHPSDIPVTLEYGYELTRILNRFREAGIETGNNAGWSNIQYKPWYL